MHFLVDEAFIELGGSSVAHLVPDHPRLIVTRTFSKAHSLAGFRIGYAVAPPEIARITTAKPGDNELVLSALDGVLSGHG